MNARIAAVLGDPAGIGPELIARLFAEPENRSRASLYLLADRAEAEAGMAVAGLRYPLETVRSFEEVVSPGTVALIEHAGNAPFERAVATANGGEYSLRTLGAAVEAARAGVVDGVLFGPLNKSSMHQAGLAHEDESQWFAHLLGVTEPHGELNVLDGLWTTRVTSHVALKDVAGLITRERILDAIRLAFSTLATAGVAAPRVAVCGLNPHNGDNGSFGREEIEVIGPAVEAAKAAGFPVTGPFPADTIFLKAKEIDAIVTMYHDQGQIAMKLMGFWRGVTVHGGLPVPITTPAHGTAFDIQGQGKANVGATQAAFDICVAMAESRRRERLAA